MITSDGSTAEYTGKDVSYYLAEVSAPKRLAPYTAECEDIIEALGMTFAEGCAFKAIWRKCAARTLGIAKAGYKGGLYDAEKAQYYGARMVAQELKQAMPDTFGQQHMINPADVELYEEPAAGIDDESPRADAIGQNGNTGEHYTLNVAMGLQSHGSGDLSACKVDADDPWAGAPEWAKFKAQNQDGAWHYYECLPVQGNYQWLFGPHHARALCISVDRPNENWRNTLIRRE